MSLGKILFICGSLNQTTMMHEISKHFNGYDNYFTPYYSDGFVEMLRKRNLLDFTILGGRFKRQTLSYMESNGLRLDYRGVRHQYDLVFTCSDLIVPQNARNTKLVLVQEGMTDPENLIYYLVKYLKIPRYLASTSTQGLSNLYEKFCVASEGYKEFFIKKGVEKEKIVVTGIPNFDNAVKFLTNKFPFKNYVLAATSDTRETFRYENRKRFIQNVLKIANGRKVIFKLHPNEKYERAIREIKRWAPTALVITEGNINEMIANCDVLITKYSSVVYLGIALEKEVYSDFDLADLKKLVPVQNHGISARKIADVGLDLLVPPRVYPVEEYELSFQET
jgi:hypothetical protein